MSGSLQAFRARQQAEANKIQLARLEQIRASMAPAGMGFGVAPMMPALDTGPVLIEPERTPEAPTEPSGGWGPPIARAQQFFDNTLSTMRTGPTMPNLDEARHRIGSYLKGDPVSERPPGMGPNLAKGEDYLNAAMEGVTPLPLKALISMPVGGKSQIGLLGRKLPRVTETLDEMAQREGYTIGSGPPIYTQGDVQVQVRPSRLTKEEEQFLRQQEEAWAKEYGSEAAKLLAKQSRANVLDYRSTHHPKEGFTLATPKGYAVDDEARTLADAVSPEYANQSPAYHRNPKTGLPWSGTERADLIENTSNKIVDEISEYMHRAANGDKNAQFIIDQSRWYTNAEKLIKDLFGEKGGKLYADIQGSMSPNTKLVEQHKMAQEFFERVLDGDFNKQLELFDEHMAKKPDNVKESSWANRLFDERAAEYNPQAVPFKADGATRYGIHSADAMKAVRDMISTLQPGMAPKMRNFAANLRGESVDPTVDLWAGRTTNRLVLGERVPPVTDAGVPGAVAQPKDMLKKGHYERALAWREKQNSPAYQKQMDAYKQEVEAARKAGEPKPPMPQKLLPPEAVRVDAERTPAPGIGGQYGISRDAFVAAAAKLGMPADDLQALLWFLEKEDWERQGFTPIDANPDLSKLIKQDNPKGARLDELKRLAEKYR